MPSMRPIRDTGTGIRMTVEAMIRAALGGGADAGTGANAERIVDAWPGRGGRLKRVRALFRYAQGTHPVLGGLRFFRDPAVEEVLVGSPMLTERRGGGDADELAVWLAAHLISVGVTGLRFALASVHEDREFHHVFVQAMPPGADRWLSLDPTVERPMGWRTREARRLGFVEIKTPAAG